MTKVTVFLAVIAMMFCAYCHADNAPAAATGHDFYLTGDPDACGDSGTCPAEGETKPEGEAKPEGEEAEPEGDETKPPECEAATDTYKSEKAGLEIQYPKGWKVDEKDENGLIKIALTPPNNDNGPVEMSVVVVPTENATLAEFTSNIEGQLKAKYADMESTKSETKLNGRPAMLLEATYTDENGNKKKGSAIFIIQEGFGYACMYKNSVDDYSKCDSAFKAMCESLKIVNKPDITSKPEEKENQNGGMPFPVGELKRQESEELGIAMKIPEKWEITDNGVFSKPDANGHKAVLTVDIYLSDDKDAKGVMEDVKKEYDKEQMQDYKVVDEKECNGDNFNGVTLTFDHTANGLKVRTATTVFVKGKYAYVINCAYTTEGFAVLQPTFEQIVKSFEVIGDPKIGEGENGEEENGDGEDWDDEGWDEGWEDDE